MKGGADLTVETVVVGPLMVNCYILGCEKTKTAIVIDPGDNEEDIIAVIKDKGLTLNFILLSHGHVDHIGAAKELQEATGSQIYVHPADMFLLNIAGIQAAMFDLRAPAPFKTTLFQENEHRLAIGEYRIEVISTPGHSPGSVCFKINNLLFSGDTLFYESIGRTDLLGGDMQQIFTSIKEKLFVLSPETTVYPGHGQATSIEHEINFNPFLTEQ
jgi:hydroxyacylglutathione hydrolase